MLSFLKPRNLMLAVVFIVCSIFIWTTINFVSDKYAAEAKVVSLATELSDVKEANQILSRAIKQTNNAEKTADAVAKNLSEKEGQYNTISRSVAASEGTNDGQIAPVLRDALRAIDGLR